METVYVRSEETPWNLVDDEAVLLNLDNGHYYSLNETARFFWEHCDGKQSLPAIVTMICDQYEIAPETAKSDFISLAEELLAEGLLVIAEQ